MWKPANLEFCQGKPGEHFLSVLVVATGRGRKTQFPQFRFLGNKINRKLVFLAAEEFQLGKTLTDQFGKGVQSPMVGLRVSF